jgi:hypothetical protein
MDGRHSVAFDLLAQIDVGKLFKAGGGKSGKSSMQGSVGVKLNSCRSAELQSSSSGRLAGRAIALPRRKSMRRHQRNHQPRE